MPRGLPETSDKRGVHEAEFLQEGSQRQFGMSASCATRSQDFVERPGVTFLVFSLGRVCLAPEFFLCAC